MHDSAARATAPNLVLWRKAIVAVGLFPEGRSTKGGQDRGELRDHRAV